MDWFFHDDLRVITLTHVSCGYDRESGGHSAAVSTTGEVYTWGCGTALGLGSIESRDRPHLVKGLLTSLKCVSVACGQSFTLALTSAGHVYAWGKWANGRLGLGQAPEVK